VPVTFGVLTTVVAFIPLGFMEGARGQIFAQIPAVVIPVLLFSLIESKLVLPAHLKNVKIKSDAAPNKFQQSQRRIATGFENAILKYYRPAEKLASFDGVFDINDSLTQGKEEIKINLKPEAYLLGLSRSSIIRQVRGAFFGLEAQRIQRGRNDVRVIVRFPKSERQSVSALRDLLITTPYCLLAIPFKSYVKPLVVMSIIPFGIIGSIAGHWLMGMNLTILSLLGILALMGVLVNDSLVLVDYLSKAREKGMELREAVLTAGTARFRPEFWQKSSNFVIK